MVTIDAFNIFLIIHIIADTIGLASGTVNIFRRKGDRIHKLIGKFFFFGMLTVSFSAFVLSVIHPNYFLFITGVFTLYHVSTGQRYLSLKQLSTGQKPLIVDWALSLFMLLFGLAFMGFGLYHLLSGFTSGLIFLVFGYIGLNMVKQDMKNYTGGSKIKNVWLTTHLQRMTGAYIAALTATLVVNFPSGILPSSLGFIPWLLPTALLVPYIFKWTRRYRVDVKSSVS